MSFFGELFGSSSSKYSKKEYQLSSEKIKELVSRVKVRSLDQKEEGLVEQTIVSRRRGDGKISLFQIDEALVKLREHHTISPTDKNGLMRVFGDYFNKYLIK